MNIKNIFTIFFLTSLCLIVACSNETSEILDEDSPSLLTVYATIGNKAFTRAKTNYEDKVDDEWSYVDFTSGDKMGFFSSGGNFSNGSNGSAPFINQALTYDGNGTNFTDADGVQFSPTHMDGSQIFMYFPYDANISSEGGMALCVNPKDFGVIKDIENYNDTLRCIDFLDANSLTLMGKNSNDKTVALYGQFDHAFAELIIMRGEGFDNPPDIEGINRWEIKAVLNKPVTGIKVNPTYEPWKCEPELVCNENDSEASYWYAWQGANFRKTVEDKEGQIAWYVIVPTLGCQSNIGKKKSGERTIVEYIELYDNDGNLQRVSSLQLSNANTKYVDAGWRYPMEITMKELVPTANPCVIVPWNSDVDLTDERTRGINDETEFFNWISAYNAYLKNKDGESERKALLNYGDLYVDSENNKTWHFYVLCDLDFSNYTSSDATGSDDVDDSNETDNNVDKGNAEIQTGTTPIIPILEDILDGQSTILSNGVFLNHTIKGLNNVLVGELTGANASIQNFDIISPNIIVNSESSASVGIIANAMTESSVVNCNIEDGTLYNPNGYGGMIAGSISGGMIKDCVVSGFLLSISADNKLVGTITGNPQFINNDTHNL